MTGAAGRVPNTATLDTCTTGSQPAASAASMTLRVPADVGLDRALRVASVEHLH